LASTRRSSEPSLLRMPRRVESPATRPKDSVQGSSQNASWDKVEFTAFSKKRTSTYPLKSLLLLPFNQVSSPPESNDVHQNKSKQRDTIKVAKHKLNAAGMHSLLLPPGKSRNYKNLKDIGPSSVLSLSSLPKSLPQNSLPSLSPGKAL
jgi:hypothetical protein